MSQEIVLKNAKRDERLKNVLFPNGYMVGVKMLTKGDLENMTKIRKPSGKRTTCQLISQVWYVGKTIVATKDDLECYAAAEILGFGKKMAEDASERYVGWQFSNSEAAKNACDSAIRFDYDTYEAVKFGPLNKFDFEPDVVLFYGNAAQMLVVISAFLRDKGGVLNFTSTGINACGAVIPAVVKTNEPKVAIPGNAWRLLALPNYTDLICGIPGKILDEIIDNAEKLRNTGAARYPTAYQHIDWAAQPPAAELLKDDGYPVWLKQ